MTSRWLIQRRKVDLPAPDGPINPRTSPGANETETFLRTGVVPKDFQTPRASTLSCSKVTTYLAGNHRSALFCKNETRVVSTRYQNAATTNSSMTRKFDVYMSLVRRRISLYPIIYANEVFLSMVMYSLPIEGTTMRKPWGTTIRNWIVRSISPSARAASL